MKKVTKFLLSVLVVTFTVVVSIIGHNFNKFENAVILRDKSCSKYVDKSSVMDYTEVIGDVSEETIEKFVNAVEAHVPQAAFNYVVNSGGKICLVEGNDVSNYGEGERVAYSPDTWLTAGDTLSDYISFFDRKVITSASVVIAADKIDSTQHEFMHVLDCCLGYASQSDEFQEIYQNIDSYHVFDVSMQDYSLDYTAQDFYYLGSEYECFAEIMARYVTGNISDERLQSYCKGVVAGI